MLRNRVYSKNKNVLYTLVNDRKFETLIQNNFELYCNYGRVYFNIQY